MNTKPLYILTRTSNRPKAFNKCVASIMNSDIDFDLRHIIATDDPESLRYIDTHPDDYSFFTTMLLMKPHIKDAITDRNMVCRPAPYNLMFNDMHDTIEEGWVMYLDDDDYIYDPQILKTLYESLTPNSLTLFNGLFNGKKILPTDKAVNALKSRKDAPIGSIGGRCFAMDITLLKKHNIEWDGYKCADNRFVNKVAKVAESINYLPITVTATQGEAGNGQKKDL